MINAFYEQNRIIAGVGNAIKVIARANIIKETKIASVEKDEEKFVRLYRGIVSDNSLVFDKNILTLTNHDRLPEFVSCLSDNLESRV